MFWLISLVLLLQGTDVWLGKGWGSYIRIIIKFIVIWLCYILQIIFSHFTIHFGPQFHFNILYFSFILTLFCYILILILKLWHIRYDGCVLGLGAYIQYEYDIGVFREHLWNSLIRYSTIQNGIVSTVYPFFYFAEVIIFIVLMLWCKAVFVWSLTL